MFCWLRTIQKDRISLKRKSGVQIQVAIIVLKNTGIKLKRLIFLSNRSLIRILYISVEFIFSCRFIADSYGNHLRAAHEIVKIETAIRSLYHIRRCQAVGKADPGCCRILLSFINTAFILPVTQVVYRCRPADIITQAEVQTIKQIV